MLVKFFKDDIIEGLQKAANIIPIKTGAAFLRTIWVEAADKSVKIMSTDSSLEFCGIYQADIQAPGLAGVQGRNFYDLVKRLPPGEITLELDDKEQTLRVKLGSRKYNLPTNDPNWFQTFTVFPTEKVVPLSGDTLHEVIEQVGFCISDDDTMEAVACMSVKPFTPENRVEFCGLNGHQFAMVERRDPGFLELLPQEGILIQRKYLLELRKWLTIDNIECAIADKRLFFRTIDGQETFSLPLSYYQYPDYHNFMSRLDEDDAVTVELDRQDVTEALERMLLFNSENNRCTFFEFSKDSLTLSSQGQEVGSGTEIMEAIGAEGVPRIAFPTRNLIEILGHFDSERVSMTLTGVEGPCAVVGKNDPGYTAIIMPMKIVEDTYYSEEDV